MSKAILVIGDMPNCCEECVMSNPDGDWCPFHGEVSYTEFGSRRPEDCPLIPMPEKPDYPPIHEESYVAGWNACIDAIGGKKDDI